MAAVQRRDEPRKFLDASLVPVEHALRARAEALEAEADTAPDAAQALVMVAVSQEFRLLADELHHW